MLKTTLLLTLALLITAPAHAVPGPDDGSKKTATADEKSKTDGKAMDKKAMDKKAKDKDKAAKNGTTKGAKEQAGGTKSKSGEMQTRKEERKAIQEEYRQSKQSGEREAVKGKKPWWKFWVFD